MGELVRSHLFSFNMVEIIILMVINGKDVKILLWGGIPSAHYGLNHRVVKVRAESFWLPLALSNM